MLEYNKLNNNKNKADNILIKIFDRFYNKLERRNFNIVVLIFIKINKVSLKILKLVIYC